MMFSPILVFMTDYTRIKGKEIISLFYFPFHVDKSGIISLKETEENWLHTQIHACTLG